MAKNDAEVYEGWTVQTHELIPTPEAVPGQTFTKEELPDPEAIKANGFDPAILENLPVEQKRAASKAKAAEVSA